MSLDLLTIDPCQQIATGRHFLLKLVECVKITAYSPTGILPGKQSLLGDVVAPVGPIIFAVIYSRRSLGPGMALKATALLNRGWYDSNDGLVCGVMSLTTVGNCLQTTTAGGIEAVLSPPPRGGVCCGI
jgi:hypothetical protein